MQRPTHPRLHVRDARDAHTVFEAVRLGHLPRVERRLNEIERSMHIRSGTIFVWEECDDELGLKRWTDGRIWSQSRMREPYLFYDERLPSEQCPVGNEQTPRSPTYRFVDGVARGGSSSSAMSHYDRSNQHPMGLVKQAYSAWVQLSPNARPKKWHLTAYFTYSDLQSIPTIDQDSLLKKIIVPSGIYKSGKARSRNSVGVLEDQNSISALSSTSPSPPPIPGSTRYPVYAASSRSPPTQLAHLSGGRYDEPYPSKRPTSPNRGAGQPVPMLPPIHASIDRDPHSRNHLARPTEDQRLINMLNSRHVR